MWKQIERSTPPRPLKRQDDPVPEPPRKAPKVAPRVEAQKTRPEPTQKFPLRLAASLTGIVFAVGLTAGIGIGIFVTDPERPATDVAVPDDQSFNSGQTLDDDGYSIPVSVYRSERALKDFVYEEDPPEELTEELLGAIPDIGLDPEPVSEPQPLPEPELALVEPEPQAPPAAEPEPEQPAELVEAEAPAPSEPPQPEETVASLSVLPDDPSTALPAPGSTVPLWRLNAVPLEVDFTRPMIAIVIDDVGINQPKSRRAIALPGRLTIALIPYGYNLPSLVDSARQNGHEVLVHLPTEPLSPDVDPGPNALLTSLSLSEIKRRIDWNLSQFDGYVGLNNHMGSRFTAWTPGMEILIREAQQRGLLFLDSITSRDTVGFRLARKVGMPNAVRDVFLDHDQRPEAIARQLSRTEDLAREKGFAIAIGHPHDETLSELSKWLENVESRGFQLVPVSAIVRRTYPQG